MTPYAARNHLLRQMGYSSYEEYLNSPLWASVRAAALKLHGRKCLICGKKHQCIHHRSYSRKVLEGLDLSALAPLCLDCHRRVEFTPDGTKRDFYPAQAALNQLLAELGGTLAAEPGRRSDPDVPMVICVVCGRPARLGGDRCRRCGRG